MFANIKRLKLWVPILPFIIYALGVGMNTAVISSNHGMMPVVVPTSYTEVSTPGTILDKAHIVYDPRNTHLTVLIDWISVSNDGVYSLGDMFLYLGLYTEVPFITVWIGLALLGKLE